MPIQLFGICVYFGKKEDALLHNIFSEKLKEMILKSKESLFRILNMICIFNMYEPLGKGEVAFNWFISNSRTIKI